MNERNQLLINGREKVGSKKLNNRRALIDYLQKIDDVYNNLEDYYPKKERKVLIVFDDMIADIEANKKLSLISTELFSRGRKLNISLVFISHSYFKVPKAIRLNATHNLIMKIPRREFQHIASNHSSDFEFKDFTKLYESCIEEPFLFLVNNTILP